MAPPLSKNINAPNCCYTIRGILKRFYNLINNFDEPDFGGCEFDGVIISMAIGFSDKIVKHKRFNLFGFIIFCENIIGGIALIDFAFVIG